MLQSLAGLIGRHRPDLLFEVLSVTESALNDFKFLRDGSYHFVQRRPEGLIEQKKLAASEHRDYAALPV